MEQGTIRLKTGLAEMLKGGVIMDVTTPEQAKIAEEAIPRTITHDSSQNQNSRATIAESEP